MEKQILWFLLAIILCKKKYNKTLDIGCGIGRNIRFIKYDYYTGTDIDQKIVETCQGQIKSPQINFITQDITKKYCTTFLKKYDLILLIQVLKNALFDQKKIDTALHNIIKMSRGKIIFNTMGNPDIDIIDNVLTSNNVKFKKIYFGLPKIIMKIKIPIVSQIIALSFLPLILIKNNFFSKNNILYICEK